MFFNFGFSEPLTVTLEQYIGNTLIQSQQLSAPLEILQAQFMSLVQQVINQSQPMKIKIITYDSIWIESKKEWKQIENSIEFKNWKDDEDET